LRAPRRNLEGELSARRIFLFFARNPLKSPDSAKEIKGNASLFAWFCLHFLAANSPSGCLQG
jgi:hypothetical protein